MTHLFLGLALLFGAAPPLSQKPPPPTPEVKALIVQLGSDEWKKREAASFKLKELGYTALSACEDAAKNNPDLEIRTRARRLVDHYYGIAFDNWTDPKNKDLPSTPSIWTLDNKTRFPLGVEITKDEDEAMPQNGDMGGGKGWCKEMKGYDLAAHYYKKARKKYNDGLKKEELEAGYRVDDGQWSNDEVEKLAMRMYLHDQLYRGKDKKALQKQLDGWARSSATHKNMHRHYGGGSLGSVIPGPFVPKEEVPEGSEYRFNGWGYMGHNGPCGCCGPVAFGMPGLVLRARLALFGPR